MSTANERLIKSDNTTMAPQRSKRVIGRERPRDDFRFSHRIFDRAAVAFDVVAVHTGGLGDTASTCTATTTDNARRFSFSGVDVGARGSLVALPFNVSLSKAPGSRGPKAPAPRFLFIVTLSIVHFPWPFSIFKPTGGRVALSLRG